MNSFVKKVINKKNFLNKRYFDKFMKEIMLKKNLLSKKEINKYILSLKEDIFVKCIMPFVLKYTRNLIISKGLNPDKFPIKKEDFIKEYNSSSKTDKHYMGHYYPSWVKESFRNPCKHPLYDKSNYKISYGTRVEVIPKREKNESLDSLLEEILASENYKTTVELTPNLDSNYETRVEVIPKQEKNVSYNDHELEDENFSLKNIQELVEFLKNGINIINNKDPFVVIKCEEDLVD